MSIGRQPQPNNGLVLHTWSVC